MADADKSAKKNKSPSEEKLKKSSVKKEPTQQPIPTETEVDKKIEEIKNNEKLSEEKPKKSSVKKELSQKPTPVETEVDKKTEENQQYVATVKTTTGPVVTSEPIEEAHKPRRKPSKRNFELEIAEEKLNQLKEAFQIFDFDRDGVIDKEDLRKSLIAMGNDIHNIDEEELDKMMSEACQPLDFDAFVMLLGYRTIELDPEEVLKDALSRWDCDGSGLINEERLRSDLMCLGDKFTEQEVNMALEDAPVKTGLGFYGDIRMIEYGKFCHILCGLRKKTKDPTLEEYGLDLNAC